MGFVGRGSGEIGAAAFVGFLRRGVAVVMDFAVYRKGYSPGLVRRNAWTEFGGLQTDFRWFTALAWVVDGQERLELGRWQHWRKYWCVYGLVVFSLSAPIWLKRRTFCAVNQQVSLLEDS